MEEARTHFIEGFKFVTKIGTVLSGLVALVTDTLTPLGPISLYIGVALLLICIVTIISHYIPVLDNRFRQMTSHWFCPILFCSLISAFIFGGTYWYGNYKNPQKGFMAEHFEKISQIQDILFDIADSTRKIESKMDTVVTHLDNTKKETSLDPRKELANMGIPWQAHAYGDILITQGDLTILELFYKGGMSPYAVNSGASPLFTKISKMDGNYKEVLAQAIQYGFDVNKKLKINIDTQLLFTSTGKKQADGNYILMENKWKELIRNNLNESKISLADYLALSAEDVNQELIDLIKAFKMDIKYGISIRKNVLLPLSIAPCDKIAQIKQAATCEELSSAVSFPRVSLLFADHDESSFYSQMKACGKGMHETKYVLSSVKDHFENKCNSKDRIRVEKKMEHERQIISQLEKM